jgi:threonine dehydratase
MIPLDKIRHAAEVIGGNIIKTPLVYSPSFSRRFGSDIYLKLENLQKTGSFKIRGAMFKLHAIPDKKQERGVVAASAGNHAQGIALAAKQAGIEATIVMPEWASITKQEATRGYGGKVILHGSSVGQSLEKALELAREGLTFIHPFDDYDIITGQGTLGLEIIEELKDTDTLVVPVGGGGLIAGVSSAVRSINPGIKIIGVQAAVCPSAYESIKAGRIVKVKSQPSIADGISVKRIGKIGLKIIEECVDDIVLVEEEDIASAMLILLERKKILTEGAGAVAFATLLNGSANIPKNRKVVLLITGGNVDTPFLGRIIGQGLIKNGRIMRIRVLLEDTPGSMARLLAIVARLKANVLHIFHSRNMGNMPIYTACVDMELETRGFGHFEKINSALKKAGYRIEQRC